MTRSPLTTRQSNFISAYAKVGNASRAAIIAGYSQKTARQQGSRLLTKVDIQQRLRQLAVTGLIALEDVASNGKNEIARVAAAKTLVEMGYGKPKRQEHRQVDSVIVVQRVIEG